MASDLRGSARQQLAGLVARGHTDVRRVYPLDRGYAHRAKILSVAAHDTPASRRASDHLPVVAHLDVPASSRQPDDI